MKNLGPGAADDVTVTLKNMSGKPVYLDQGRNKLGAIAVNETKSAALRFSVRTPTDEAQLRLSVWDGTLGSSISELLKLPVVEARKAKSETNTLRVSKEGEAPLYIGADEKMPVAAYAKSGAIIKSDVSFGNWWRVEGISGGAAYIKQGDIELAKGKKAGKEGIRAATWYSAPDIALQLPSLVVNGETLHLKGQATDDRKLKDIFVFVNEKKVFYRSVEDLKHDEKGGVVAPIDVPLTLKKGSNTIGVIVREDDDMMARKIFGVLRTDAKFPETAPEGDAHKGKNAAPAKRPD